MFSEKRNNEKSKRKRILKSKVTLQHEFFNESCSVRPKAPACTCLQGSMAVEAAFVMPLGVFLLVLIISLFLVLDLQSDVEKALQYAVRNCAAVSVSAKDRSYPGTDLLLAKGDFRQKIKTCDPPIDYVKGSYGGISLLASKEDARFLELTADYEVQLPIQVFGKKSFSMHQSARARKWNGYSRDFDGDGDETDGRKVYITESGTVYHNSLSCQCLDLSIHTVSKTQVEQMRSMDGSKYYECPLCKKMGGSGDAVYITNYGTNYHTSLGCSGLKRTIEQVSLDDITGKTPCKFCCGKDENND